MKAQGFPVQGRWGFMIQDLCGMEGRGSGLSASLMTITYFCIIHLQLFRYALSDTGTVIVMAFLLAKPMVPSMICHDCRHCRLPLSRWRSKP